MKNSKESGIQAIRDYITQHDGPYLSWSAWYIGITSDPKKRLFEGHRVDEENGIWIYKTTESSSTARQIEDYFVNELGADGGTGGGDYNTRAVYAYKKTRNTVETA
ncbi:MAG: hypothetical protein ACKKMW_01870 [Candidatus Nealsonbacteria bacterium]